MITHKTATALIEKPSASTIKQAIKESGLSQAEIARRMGIRPESITRWAQGRRLPQPVYLKLFIGVVNG